ncbi:hypothetical protein LguiA_026141 [Lonicera macranthoides]
MNEIGHWSFGASFYRKQLTLDYLLGTYKKPVVALINGIVMGGGAGISMHARFRIVTENTIFAMPEVSIGLFPDVGASHFLSRLPCFHGEYLGLTGARLDGKAMLTCGLATHFVLSKDLASLENALDVAASSNVFNISTILAIVNKYSQKGVLTQDNIPSRLETIKKCFSGESVEEILSSLIRDGRAQKLDQCLIREFNILCHMMRRTISEDLFEGCRAMLIDKDKNPHVEGLVDDLAIHLAVAYCSDYCLGCNPNCSDYYSSIVEEEMAKAFETSQTVGKFHLSWGIRRRVLSAF